MTRNDERKIMYAHFKVSILLGTDHRKMKSLWLEIVEAYEELKLLSTEQYEDLKELMRKHTNALNGVIRRAPTAQEALREGAKE